MYFSPQVADFVLLILDVFFQFFPLLGVYLICDYTIIYCVGAGISTLMSLCDGLDPYFFLSKGGKEAVYEGKKGRKVVYFGILPALGV